MGSPLKTQATVKRLARYMLTGGTAAVVDLAGFAILSRAGLPLFAAASCSFCVAAIVNYILTSIFVFKEPLRLQRMTSFFLFALVGLGVNTGVTVAVTATTGWPPWMAKTTGIGVAFLVNFWLNSVVVFRGATGRNHLSQG